MIYLCALFFESIKKKIFKKKRQTPADLEKNPWALNESTSFSTWKKERTKRWIGLLVSGSNLSIRTMLVKVTQNQEVMYRKNKRHETLGWRLTIYVNDFNIECMSGKIVHLR